MGDSQVEVARVGDSRIKSRQAADLNATNTDDDRVDHTAEDDAPASVEPTMLDQVELALVTLGFRRAEARAAIRRASTSLNADADLETVMRAALRECPRGASFVSGALG